MLLTRKVYANSAEVAATFPQTQLAAESRRGRGNIATAKDEPQSPAEVAATFPQQKRRQNSTATLPRFLQEK